MEKKSWTQAELNTLQRSYQNSSWADLEQSLGRSESSIRSKASRLGLVRGEIDLTDVFEIRKQKAEAGLLIDL